MFGGDKPIQLSKNLRKKFHRLSLAYQQTRTAPAYSALNHWENLPLHKLRKKE
jgi:hypothetical protein